MVQYKMNEHIIKLLWLGSAIRCWGLSEGVSGNESNESSHHEVEEKLKYPALCRQMGIIGKSKWHFLIFR
jgi:hypothetical protein